MPSKKLVRLQKFIADSGLTSRRKAEGLISSGKVKVNNRVVTELGTKVDPAADQVFVGRHHVRPAHRGIALFHKPRGVITTLNDPEGRPCVADYLTTHYRSYFPVGRLDWDSSGLLILTNDGELAEHLMHPRYGFERVYEAKVSGIVDQDLVERIKQGIKLEDGVAKAKVQVISAEPQGSLLRIKLNEGRNRLIRRLFEAVRHPVLKLKRLAYGPFRLGKLPSGQLKKLSEREYQYFRTRVMAGHTI